MKTTLERVTETAKQILNCDPDKIVPDATFVEHLGCDSLDAIEFVMYVEEEFGVEITDEDMETTATVGALAALVDRKLSEKTGAPV